MYAAQVGVLMHPETNAHLAFWREAEAAGHALGVDTQAGAIHDADEIKQAVASVAVQPSGGLIVLPHGHRGSPRPHHRACDEMII
jgi:hypothetical protein